MIISHKAARGVTRRDALVLAAGSLASATGFSPALAADETETHGISTFGDLKYPADFKQLDYVDVNAPKGGLFSQVGPSRQYNQNFLTFNSLNSYILKGDAAQGMQLTFAGLMLAASDEPDSMYGLAARAVRISADGLTYRYLLRPEARFHDGTKLTAHDVAFSLKLLKGKGHPIIGQMTRDLVGAEAEDDATVVLRFAPNRARDVPLFVSALPIFSRAYYSAKNFEETTLDPPLGSGPYKVGRFESGRYIEYDRVKDWWGAELPIARGQYNFDVVRYEFYRDRDVAFEGFTAKSYLFREEFTARVWATRYDFPAIKDGRVKQRTLHDDTPSGGQGWFMNTRRDKFKNIGLREAMIHAFDFEWTNKSIMYSAYKRTFSVFQNSNMTAEGKPSPASSNCSSRSAARCPTRYSASRSCRRCRTDRARTAQCCARQRICSSRPATDQEQQARRREGRAGHSRVPDRRADVPAAPHAIHQESRRARHRGEPAYRRSGAVPQAGRRVRFRHHDAAFQFFHHAGRLAAQLFFLPIRECERLVQSRRHDRSGGRRVDREHHRGRDAVGTHHCLPRARPGDPRRTVLDSALVSGGAPDCLLGRVRISAEEARIFPRNPRNVVV